ncbi:MAG TPA: hypothetical protein EYG68_04110 [Leucothrix mucor]|nr:hypothetical protein [Leucothrix mucor]
MKNRLHYLYLPLLLLFILAGCNSANNKEQILAKCSILGDEARQYGRANYLRLFYSMNPEKFEATYQKVATFDNKHHRAMINTYVDAVSRLKTNDETAQRLISATQELTQFVTSFVDDDYAVAANHKHHSRNNPKSDDFFIEINSIVKFDQNLKGFDSDEVAFKSLLEDYNKALGLYAKQAL